MKKFKADTPEIINDRIYVFFLSKKPNNTTGTATIAMTKRSDTIIKANIFLVSQPPTRFDSKPPFISYVIKKSANILQYQKAPSPIGIETNQLLFLKKRIRAMAKAGSDFITI